MKYNFKSEQEANEFLDQIANPDKIRLFAKQKLGIELPSMKMELDNHTIYTINGKRYSKQEMLVKHNLERK